MPVGTEVIVKDDSMNPYRLGKIVGHDQHHSGSVLPLVKYVNDPKTYLCFSIVRHQSEELQRALNKLNGIEQWNVMAKHCIVQDSDEKA